MLLDPNLLSGDGTVAVTSVAVTDDGSLLAYATSAAGSDWATWHVREVATGTDRADLVEWSRYGTGGVAGRLGLLLHRHRPARAGGRADGAGGAGAHLLPRPGYAPSPGQARLRGAGGARAATARRA